MKPTRRGIGVGVVVAFCLLMGWQYGARSLNALVAPLVVVLAGAVIAVYLTDEPVVTHGPIEEGFIGETRTAELDVDVDRPVAATISDAVDDGLAATGNVIETTLGDDERLAYDVRLRERGEHTVGPSTVEIRDVLGIVKRRFECPSRETVLVYPRVYDLRGAGRGDLALLVDAVREYAREEFDHLREYERGDALRDVHWKSTARRPDDEIVVKEFVADEEIGTVEIAAESIPDRTDEMAAATASVVTYLLEMDVSVGVSAPNGGRRPDSGRDHHVDVLRLLARSDAGEVDRRLRTEADILIQSDANGTTVRVEGHDIPFDRLRGRNRGRSGRRDETDGATARRGASV